MKPLISAAPELGDLEQVLDDIDMTLALEAAADIVGIQFVDHVIVAGRGGGFTSLHELGIIQPTKESTDEQRAADQAL